jgi:hypothetical protein
MELQTRKQYVKKFVWSVALYGSEAWTIGKVDQKRLEAFETWCWMRLLSIKWTDKIRNEIHIQKNIQSIQKNRRRADLMEQHREKKNQMYRPHLETQWTREEYNRRKNRGEKSQEEGQGTNTSDK